MRLFKILLVSLLSASSFSAWALEEIHLDCKRYEKNYTEEYEMKIVPALAHRKAKVYLDERDLDRSDEYGRQIVKSVTFAHPKIVIWVEASFAPEIVTGISYSAGTVSTQISIDTITGKLKKTEKIQGGILGATMGDGTRFSEEDCLLSQAANKAK
jgi:hypothetical protein